MRPVAKPGPNATPFAIVKMIDGLLKFYLEEPASILSPQRSHKNFTLQLLENMEFVCQLVIFAARTYKIFRSLATIVYSSGTNSRTQLSRGHMFSITGLYDTLHYISELSLHTTPLYYAYLYTATI
jgi:hypothetical protein